MLKVIIVILVLAAVAVAGAAYKFGFILNPSPSTPQQGMQTLTASTPAILATWA